MDRPAPDLSAFDRGFFVGLIVGEGSFGGDGKQPQLAVRMHTRHRAVFDWLVAHFPRSKLYGPYTHGGRSYYQWMARGTALVADVLPVLETELTPDVDEHAAARMLAMLDRYGPFIHRERERLARAGREPAPSTAAPSQARAATRVASAKPEGHPRRD